MRLQLSTINKKENLKEFVGACFLWSDGPGGWIPTAVQVYHTVVGLYVFIWNCIPYSILSISNRKNLSSN